MPALFVTGAVAQMPSGEPVPVTVENFIRAESDTYFAGSVKHRNLGTISHTREVTPSTIRPPFGTTATRSIPAGSLISTPGR